MRGASSRKPRAEGALGDRKPSIIVAAFNNSISMAEEAMADDPTSINDRDFEGRTALHIAVGRGNLSMVRYLLTRADIDTALRDANNRDALDLAILVGHPVVKDELFRFVAKRLELDGGTAPAIVPRPPEP